jgi:two-component system LytT family sensor kinase
MWIFFALAGLLPAGYMNLRRWYFEGFPYQGRELLTRLAVDFGISIFITLAISIPVVYALIWLEKKLPWRKSISKRILAEVALVLSISFTITLILQPLFFSSPDHNPNHPDSSIFGFLTTTSIMAAILVSIYEGRFLFKEWKKSLIQTEKLEKEQMISRYEMLKNQVNPHFLFNSLNVLSGLIHSDPDKAEAFLDDFSSVYRYVLEQQDENLVPLRQELEFLTAFLSLYQIRYGDNFQVAIQVHAERLGDYLPPLTLQLLAENAVKHNKISRKHPLHLEVYDEDGTLVVKNNLQLREDGVRSTGLGLNNLRERYRLLPSQPQPEFIMTEDAYLAKVPLLKKE